MKTILLIIAGPLFLISVAAWLYVQIRLRPRPGDGWEDFYHEFEDQHPTVACYNKYSKLTFAIAAIAALLLFLTLVL
jgi:hypothetical protein